MLDFLPYQVMELDLDSASKSDSLKPSGQAMFNVWRWLTDVTVSFLILACVNFLLLHFRNPNSQQPLHKLKALLCRLHLPWEGLRQCLGNRSIGIGADSVAALTSWAWGVDGGGIPLKTLTDSETYLPLWFNTEGYEAKCKMKLF